MSSKNTVHKLKNYHGILKQQQDHVRQSYNDIDIWSFSQLDVFQNLLKQSFVFRLLIIVILRFDLRQFWNFFSSLEPK